MKRGILELLLEMLGIANITGIKMLAVSKILSLINLLDMSYESEEKRLTGGSIVN